MTPGLAAAYRSGSQRARVVTESWGEQNLFCPNCSSPNLSRLQNNTRASDFACPSCKFWFQLKGQKTRIGNSITDGAYEAMMTAIRNDETPNFFFLHYDLATWNIKNLVLIPSFAFPPSAIIKRPPLSSTARRAGWIGCNLDLTRIPADARIDLVRTIDSPSPPRFGATLYPIGGEGRVRGLAQQERVEITPPSEVREKFRRVKPLSEIPLEKRGWMLDVLNVVRRLGKTEFTNQDIYAHESHFQALYPGNQHIRDKIRQQLQELARAGFLIHAGRNDYRLVG